MLLLPVPQLVEAEALQAWSHLLLLLAPWQMKQVELTLPPPPLLLVLLGLWQVSAHVVPAAMSCQACCCVLQLQASLVHVRQLLPLLLGLTLALLLLLLVLCCWACG